MTVEFVGVAPWNEIQKSGAVVGERPLENSQGESVSASVDEPPFSPWGAGESA